MMMIKSLLLAGFMLASVFVANGDSKPAMATLHVQSNFDFSLTRKEFRVHYSGLGGYSTSETASTIKIYKQGSDQEIHSFSVDNKDTKAIYQFALNNAEDGKYEVAVCVGGICSEKNPALTDTMPVPDMKIKCKRVRLQGSAVEDAGEFSEAFFGPGEGDWIQPTDFQTIESNVNAALTQAKKTPNYQTEFNKLGMTQNPQYKHAEQTFYGAVYYEIRRFKQLFDKMPAKGAEEGKDYADEYCERKYLLSAHAHIVKKGTKEVIERFKTTLFLSEGGKQLFVLHPSASKVHVEMAHTGVQIPAGNYDLWVTFCATEKDAIDSTFCADPLIKEDFQISH